MSWFDIERKDGLFFKKKKKYKRRENTIQVKEV